MTSAATATLLDAALDYARRGWVVILLHGIIEGRCTCGKDCGKNAGKHPMLTDWPNQATTDPATIQRWWQRWPDANVGIVAGARSGLIAVDGDPRHGGDDTLRELEAQHSPLPATVESCTGGGGFHKLLRHPGYPVKSGAGVLGPGLDIKADGGYIVAPPSLHLSGRRYCWEAASHPDDVPIAEAPAWLLGKLRPEATNGTGRGFTVGETIKDGERNDTLYRAARSMKAKEWSVDATLAAVLKENELKCNPPLDPAEVEKIVAHAYQQPDRPEFAATDAGDRQESALTSEPPWPTLAPEALYGLAGDIVRAIDPYTEADPMGTLAHVLAGFGSIIGSGAHAKVQHSHHPARLDLVLVGNTSAGRKGTAWSTPRHLFAQVDEAWARGRVQSGLSSGEGLIYHVRDAREEQQAIKERGRVIDYQTVIVDAGEADKRLFIIEPEFATVLKRMAAEANTLSSVIREAWDSGNLSTLTKNSPMRATGAHVSIVAHVTKEELSRYLTETERANGFANRFLWLLVRKSKLLPDGEAVPEQALVPLAKALSQCVDFAKGVGVVERDAEARELWHVVYPALATDKLGMVGAIVSRAEAHVLRLSVLYALLDCSDVIRATHVKAALALWDYAEASAQYIFGEIAGDPVADRILSALRSHGAMSETDIYSTLFHRNTKATRIHQALDMLQRVMLISSSIVEETGGREKTMWEATH